jgi:hypothetical protein
MTPTDLDEVYESLCLFMEALRREVMSGLGSGPTDQMLTEAREHCNRTWSKQLRNATV